MTSLEKAFDAVRQQPFLPVEVASKIGVDSFLAKAFLDQLVEAGRVKATTEKVAGVPIYFVMGQELAAEAKLKKLLGVKTTATNFAKSVPQGPALEQKRADFKARLEEIERKEAEMKNAKEAKEIKITAKSQLRVRDLVKPKAEIAKPKVEASFIKKEEPKPAAPAVEEMEIPAKEISLKAEEPKAESIQENLAKAVKKLISGATSPVVEATLNQLNGAGAEIISQELRKRGKEAFIVAKIPSSIGPLQFLVIAMSKKTITKDDLSLAYAEGVEQKLPVLLYSNGKIAKPAQAYLDKVAGVVKFKQLVS